MIKEIIDTGVIGPVHEVHVWADRAWGLQDAASAEKFDKPHGFYNGIQIVDRFKEEMPIPSNMHWDLWLGHAPERPFHATYFPGPRWYRWWDFGNGTMSDLGSHDNDVPYTVLDLWRPDSTSGRALAPLTVEAVSPNVPKPHKELPMPSETLPRSPGHWIEWVNYAKGNGPVPGSNFQYSGWTTEANHLGNVAYRSDK